MDQGILKQVPRPKGLKFLFRLFEWLRMVIFRGFVVGGMTALTRVYSYGKRDKGHRKKGHRGRAGQGQKRGKIKF